MGVDDLTQNHLGSGGLGPTAAASLRKQEASYVAPAIAVTLGLLRQWMWAAETWREVLTVLGVTSAALFILLVVPFTRRLLGHLLSVQPARRQPGTSVREKRGAAAVAVHHQQQQAAAAAAAAQLNNASKQQQALQMQLQAASLRATEAAPDASTDGRRVRLKDAGQVFCMIHTANEMTWPSAALKAQSGQPAWGEWRPYTGVEGRICHYWLGNAEKVRATGQGLARRSCLAYDLVVVRVQDADQQKTFVASLEGLEPADTVKDDIVLPRDGDTVVYPIAGPKAGII